MIKPFPHYPQVDSMDCGPTCLRMIARHYGRSYTLQTLREKSYITREGVSMLGISDAAESIGFHICLIFGKLGFIISICNKNICYFFIIRFLNYFCMKKINSRRI
jgi:ABC-type bacteriocin/lantibiotic exporter with double-glycine peptidase domain